MTFRGAVFVACILGHFYLISGVTALRPKISVVDKAVVARKGSTVTLMCSATRVRKLTTSSSWEFNGQEIKNRNNKIIIPEPHYQTNKRKGNFTLTIKNVSDTDVGTYTCKVSKIHLDRMLEAKENIELSLQDEAVSVILPVVKALRSYVVTSEGSNVTLTCIGRRVKALDTMVKWKFEGQVSVQLVSERMRCDLHDGLVGIPSLRKRLEIALDVAKALQYLHGEELIHRDVKMQNVLLDEKNNAKLTDLGLCKPEGLICNSLVGTPINMAPEMMKQQYDKSIDVYAFGMLLWRVCEGQGNQPQNINRHFLPLVMLMMNAVDNKTPERLDVFPEQCWQLMERCWNQDPEARPSFDSVVRDLETFLAEMPDQ